MNKEMPSPEELNRIQKENLTDEQIEKDNKRGEVFEAGRQAGQKIFIEGKSGYNAETKFFFPSEENLTEERVVELIEKLPKIHEFDVCQLRGIMSKKIVDKFFERFPQGVLTDFEHLDKSFRDEYMTIENGKVKTKSGYVFRGGLRKQE